MFNQLQYANVARHQQYAAAHHHHGQFPSDGHHEQQQQQQQQYYQPHHGYDMAAYDDSAAASPHMTATPPQPHHHPRRYSGTAVLGGSTAFNNSSRTTATATASNASDADGGTATPDECASVFDGSGYSLTHGHASCAVCHVQHVPFAGAACSRRCNWVAQGGCPQCGRWAQQRGPLGTFCSGQCAMGARQANWCLSCGVRQLAHGTSSCGAAGCVVGPSAGFASFVPAPVNLRAGGGAANGNGASASSSSAMMMSGSTTGSGRPVINTARSSARNGGGASATTGRGGAGRRQEPHTVFDASDKTFAMIRQQLGADAGRRAAAAVKIGGHVDDRKAYTAYRGRVEGDLNDVCGIGAPKFGHGGEGNEHRRFVPLVSECGTRCVDSVNVRPCGHPRCQVCAVLERGLAAAAFADRHSVPCVSSAAKAAELAEALKSSPTRHAAVLVVRATVGNPVVRAATPPPPSALLATSAALEEPASGPSIPKKEHCVVVQHGGFDVAHLPSSLPTVDPLFIALIAPAAPATAASSAMAPNATDAVAADAVEQPCAAAPAHPAPRHTPHGKRATTAASHHHRHPGGRHVTGPATARR